MFIRTFTHLATEALVIATVLTLALPFFLAVSSPFILR
jgi:hypothetical protein